ncbi:unnamed protein product [Peronospora destructor]|uniref:Nucleolar 27S pre-rRNA processing Urb2/Npa2 C-terminal domain-containing protein n=1 Tax=Peronospora destructor TaxID=86335 RepID=A0AAV0SYN1_9STRA|nr:unnamed protein product [Peronospora destructor]
MEFKSRTLVRIHKKEHDILAVRFQQKLRPGVFALLDVCSPYEKETAFRGAGLQPANSLLKTLDTNYKLTHRYVGKV